MHALHSCAAVTPCCSFSHCRSPFCCPAELKEKSVRLPLHSNELCAHARLSNAPLLASLQS